jgi:hypothetical protein
VTGPDLFTVLGLPARPGLTDEQVRAAWRAIAAATHPDRPGGGDPGRYAAASAAYATLRTGWGRSEAYADLAAQAPPPVAAAPRSPARVPARWLATLVGVGPARIRHGRPGRLALRVLAAVLLAVLAVRAGAGGPAAGAVVAGLGIWLILTARGDLAPPPGR